MHSSYTPLGNVVQLFNMLSGEVVFGGVGAGLYGMLLYAVIAVFVAGLMVGRTPEYLGKKIGKFDVQMAMLAMLILALCILGFTAVSSVLDLPRNGTLAWVNAWPGSSYGAVNTVYGAPAANLSHTGPHGFSELFYAYTSATANNGSAFAGLTANTPYYNVTMGLAMLFGRFMMIIPLLAMAGSLAEKPVVAASAGTFPTDSLMYVALLVGVVIIVGALTFFAGLALGPIVEQLKLNGMTLL
jgi:K+-transporting ATPase ATPase A chain